MDPRGKFKCNCCRARYTEEHLKELIDEHGTEDGNPVCYCSGQVLEEQMDQAEKINARGIKVDRDALAAYRQGLVTKTEGYGRPEMTDRSRQSWINLLDKIENEVSGLFGEKDVLYPRYKQGTAVSNRWTCTHINMHGIQPELRHIFVAREGYKMVTMDLDQSQYRILVQLADEEVLLEPMRFNDNFNIHDIVAMDLGVSRKVAKVVNFGMIFGMTGWGVGKRCGKSEQWGDAVITKWRAKYKRIAAYIDSIHRQLRTEGQVTAPCGLVYKLDEKDSRSVHKALANILQGEEAALVTEGVRRLQDATLGLHVVACTHDEVTVEVPEEVDVETVRNIWLGDTDYTMDTTVEVGGCWK